MTYINDCSYNESKVTLCDNDDNDDDISPITDFCGFDLSDDEQGQDNGFPQSVTSNLSSLSKNLQLLAEKLKF
jgi:hypothetical protein